MNWHFGDGIGINFSSGSPVPFTGSSQSTNESCYTVNDTTGNLLFYTNGIQVWDATNTQMPNGFGLLGHTSSQCMVVPKPGNPKRYFIISTDADSHFPANGMTYSEVDMTLNGGNGDIIPSVKNIVLSASSGEWITAIAHSNCSDTWVISHGNSTNSVFMAYKVSNTGINPIPVTTNLGVGFTINDKTNGIMRPNPDGSKIVMTRPIFTGAIDIIDFDNSSGIATQITNLYTPTGFNKAYGAEFSRSGDVLYVGEFGGDIFQYDMTALNIPSTRTLIGNLSLSGEIGQLQIAPDDKIYVNYNIFPSGGNFIGRINSPDLLGSGCDFVQNAVSFGTTTIYGLPWYYSPSKINSSELNLGADTTICADTDIIISLESSLIPTTYLWIDGSTNSSLNITTAGSYWVQRQIGTCPLETDTIIIAVDPSKITSSLNDISGCSPLTIDFTANGSNGISNWSWNLSDGSTINTQSGTYSFKNSGEYTISLSAISANNCILNKGIISTVEVFENPIADFTWSDQPTILENPIFFEDNSTTPIANWEWIYQEEEVSHDSDFVLTPHSIHNSEITLKVENIHGCTDELQKNITFKMQNLIFVPNAFTPNGDGLNDVFRITDYYNIVIEFSIYNRWGDLIWSANSSNYSWDGTQNNKIVQNGIYPWVIKAKIGHSTFDKIEGHLTLIR